VDIRETGMNEEECFIITIHGIDHYLHATTAYELYKKMGEVITEWDKEAKRHGAPGVIE
jgi:hypothetical protein